MEDVFQEVKVLRAARETRRNVSRLQPPRSSALHPAVQGFARAEDKQRQHFAFGALSRSCRLYSDDFMFRENDRFYLNETSFDCLDTLPGVLIGKSFCALVRKLRERQLGAVSLDWLFQHGFRTCLVA